MCKWWVIFIILLCWKTTAVGQYGNLRSEAFVMADSIRFDTARAIEGSMIVRSGGKVLNQGNFKVDYAKAMIHFIKPPDIDSVELVWRQFSPLFTQPYYHKSQKLLQTQKRYKLQNNARSRRHYLQGSEINRSGSISRGFTVGNNQDVTMNSNLNLQLSGKLTDNLSVVASITDNNIPVQPEGNTQQLQEFDKIFIRVFNEKTDLILGDYNLKSPTGTFMNVNKKLQGIQISHQHQAGETDDPVKIKNTASGAVSKGKYFRQQISPIEGNQGPYKLRGANDERFIIVIAGSEKVFIDGEQLKRGEQHDYTIDYNSAEITFNPTAPINSDMRIYVEFEYTDKKYTRFLIADYAEIKKGNTRVWTNVISESDSKNQPIDQDLDSDEINVLENVGDNTDAAVVENITEQEFDEDFILYAKKDSAVENQTYEVYYYSVNPDSAKYRLGFSLVGNGNGNYVQTNNLANGKVYRWVAPVNGVPQGNYAPVVKLTAPQSQQMITTGAEVNHSNQSYSRIEVAWSHFDKNTFSTKDQNNDHGLALNYDGNHQFTGDSSGGFGLSSKYQFVQNNFNPFERFRATEFERDWNARDVQFDVHQHLAGISLNYYQKQQVSAGLGTEAFILPGRFEGIKGNGQFSLNTKVASFSGTASYLQATADSIKSNFLRSSTKLSVPFWYLEGGLRQKLEINKFKFNDGSLNNNAYKFFVYEAYVKNKKLDKIEAELTASYRTDHKAYQAQMERQKERRGISLSGTLNQNSNSTWRLVVNYREVRILNDSLVNADVPDQHVSARVENRSVLFDGILRSNTFYEVSTGLESKKEYSYLEVEPGQGNYVWIDRNDNGTKELNEFEVAQIAAEGNHIRMYIPTDEYISVYANQFKQTLTLNFRQWSVSKNQWLKALSRFSDQFSYTVNQKVTDDHFANYANPFGHQTGDSVLISTSQSLRNMLSFNKTNPKFGADLIMNNTTNKSLLTNGFEGRQLKTMELQTRWNITQYLSLLNSGAISDKSKTAQYFTGNNYTIRGYKAEATLRLQPKVTYRFELKYTFDEKQNTQGIETATHHDGGVVFQYAAAQKNSINASVHYIDVKFKGSGNNSLTYELLNGLQRGGNYTWEVDWSRQLSDHFQMSIRYNGRAGDNSETIHMGSMKVRAMF